MQFKNTEWTAYQTKLITIALVFIFSFLSIRVFTAEHIFMVRFADDDGGYYAYAEAIFDTQTINWCDKKFSPLETLQRDCKQGNPGFNMYTPGPAIVLSPFLLAGSILEFIGLDFSYLNIQNTLFWWMTGTFFIAILSALLLLESTYLLWKNYRASFYITALFLTGHFVMFYFFRRPMMAHAAEFFLLCCVAFSVIKLWQSEKKSIKWLLCLSFSCGLLFLTRIDDLYMGAIIGIWLLFCPYDRNLKIRNVAVYVSFCLLSLWAYLHLKSLQTGQFTLNTSYSDVFSSEILFDVRLSNLRRIFDFYFGPHWGVSLLSPIYLLEFILISIKWRSLVALFRKNLLAVSLSVTVLIVHLNLLANLPNPMSYGYRHLLGNYMILHFLFLFLWKTDAQRLVTRKLFLSLAGIAALVGFLNLINYHSNQSTLTLTKQPRWAAGVYSPYYRDGVVLDAPNYNLHSLASIIQLKSFKNIGSSPVIAYPYSILPKEWKERLGPLHEYYSSSKRKIYGFHDLKILWSYHSVVMFGIFIVLFPAWLRRKMLTRKV